MDWKVFREQLVSNSEVKEELDNNSLLYEIVYQIIQSRIEKNMTQSELANTLGVEVSAIVELESGDSYPNIEFLRQVAKVLHKKLNITLTTI
ncbi:MAG TPA: helix-turn-helix transcriptional regulator [Clostridia bacterium]|nr:helix-turn-helix transcriptional regulator [Clostridia bacterium]